MRRSALVCSALHPRQPQRQCAEGDSRDDEDDDQAAARAPLRDSATDGETNVAVHAGVNDVCAAPAVTAPALPATEASARAAPPTAARRERFVPPARRAGFQAPGRGAPATATHTAATTGARSRPATTAGSAAAQTPATFFTCHYTKRSNKKHKVYCDGFVKLENDRVVTLYSEDGKQVSVQRFGAALGGLHEGNTLEVRSFELEVCGTVGEDEWRSGRAFLSSSSMTAAAAAAAAASGGAPTEKENRPPAGSAALVARRGFRPVASSGSSSTAGAGGKRARITGAADDDAIARPSPTTCAFTAQPRYDPSHPCAFELVPARSPHEPTVLTDPFLGHMLRPHQVDGVRFLYRRIANEDGLRQALGGNGAILADEMGLGKTLQAITLVWTALKQGPRAQPLIARAVVVCPASLVGNWAREFNKWLGAERLQPLVLMTGDRNLHAKLNEFRCATLKPVAIVSYEMVRKVHKKLSECNVGLVICDEGHRLKSAAGNKTIHALAAIRCTRRVLLTGTPLQNDLDEMWAMVHFVNPGAMGELPVFRTVFAEPIARAQDSRATCEERELGETRAAELGRLTQQFILRRTTETLREFLPPRMDVTLFVPLSALQRELYESFVHSSSVRHLFGQRSIAQAAALSAITRLRKLCNHPALLHGSGNGGNGDDGVGDSKPRGANARDDCASAKMLLVRDMLRAFHDVGDRCVLISNYTSTLDLLEGVCREAHWTFLRLDGSTPAKEREALVSRFNDTHHHNDTFCFLLSNKAGGVGLNLIGGNRLILYDSDWNPANDKQAMARVWRDGQRKTVFVYRLVTSGTIEEKIYQRQVFKSDLATAMEGGNGGGGKNSQAGQFSKDDLRELFNHDPDAYEQCETLELLRARMPSDDGRAGAGAAERDVCERGKQRARSGGSRANDAPRESIAAPAGLLADMEPYASGERAVTDIDHALHDVMRRHRLDFAFLTRRNVGDGDGNGDGNAVDCDERDNGADHDDNDG